MSKLPSLVAIPVLVALAAACSDSDDAKPTNTGGVTGQLSKVQLVTYFGRPDGTSGEASGRFVLEAGAL